MYDEALLKKMDLAVVGIDRPYYGQVSLRCTKPDNATQPLHTGITPCVPSKTVSVLCTCTAPHTQKHTAWPEISVFMVVVVSRMFLRRQSEPHALRTLTSFAADLEDLSNQLLPGRRIFLAGASGGGPYALAAAVKMRDRVRGVLLISPASHPGLLAPVHDVCMHAWTESTACSSCQAFSFWT